MLTHISSAKKETLMLELSEGQDVGTIGGYCEEGFPIYYANDKMAHMLGYTDVDDLITGIHGLVANTIHPDDLDRVGHELNDGGFYEGMTYKITYRMPKKDGSYIWTVDKGKVVSAEDGRLAIISVCNDMTEFLDHHAELERMNQLSKSTIENMPGGYHRCAAEEGYPFLYVSDRFLDMFGWTRDEIKTEFDNKFINMLHPKDREEAEDYVGLLNREEEEVVFDAIYRMRAKTGYIWVSDATSLVTAGENIFYQGTLTNITEFVEGRQDQDEIIKEQLDIFDSLSRGFLNIFWINVKDGTAKILKLDGYITSGLDKEDHRFFDYPTILNQYISDRVHPEDKEMLHDRLCIEHLREVFKNQDEYIGNYRILVDGEVHYYQYNLSQKEGAEFIVCGFQNIDAIIEEHLEVERAEREHNEVISSLSTIYSTIIRVDIETHEYEVLNSESLMAETVPRTGDFEDVSDIIIENFMTEEYREPLREFLDLNTLADRLDGVNTIATDYKVPTGQWMQARFIAKRRDKAGRAREILYVVNDITAEKMRTLQQQESLAHALTAAEQASVAKTTFLNSMSHDIRTPMNAIIGFTSLAQNHMDEPKKVEEYLGKISTSSAHLLSLINDVLDMSRIESGTVTLDENAIHLPDLLEELQTMMLGMAEESQLKLSVDMEDVEHEDVIADKLRLNQVLLNIASNAVKFTPSGGEVRICLAEKQCNRKAYARYEFTVVDTGIGMSQEFIGHIFDTFSREHSSTVSGIQGTGLGMAITKNIVDMMGGEITVESEEGKGTTFTVCFDLLLAQDTMPESGAEKNSVRESYDYSDKRILLVEDNELNREIATALLEETGMKIDSVTDGDEAVAAIIDSPADRYDLILMDIQMPRMDGYTATREIRTLPDNRKANIPIVAMTANAFEEDKRKAFNSGMNGHIIKPINVEAMAEVLDDILFAE